MTSSQASILTAISSGDLEPLLSDEGFCKSWSTSMTLLPESAPATLQVATATSAPATPGHQNEEERSDAMQLAIEVELGLSLKLIANYGKTRK